ncbi:MAG: hypothetical protein OXC18_15780 [Desulfurellaceae bacterium]|nr:hypothetical protein [Desulfurellaceae bacterium]
MTEAKRIERLEGEVLGLHLTVKVLLSKLDMGDDFDLALKEEIGKITGVPADQVDSSLPLQIKERGAAFTTEMVLSFLKANP